MYGPPLVDHSGVRTGPPDAGEHALVAALQARDERAFALLVDRYYTSMLRVARMYVATKEAAEDVVQETLLGVVSGIGRFEGRSSLKTWLFRILVNRAQTRGAREARSRPFSSFDSGADEPFDPDRFIPAGHRWAGYWAAAPGADMPAENVLAAEFRGKLDGVIEGLPANQRLVITLRDVQGFSPEEACEMLGITDANQRVLLHRARTRVRSALERYLGVRTGAVS